MRVRIRHLTIFLLKEGWQGDDAIRLHPDSFTQLPVTAPSFDGALYLRKREPNIPDWIRFIEPHVVGGTALQMESYVPSAVLVLPAAGRNFALTFGHGRSMLDPESYERRYGLRVVINRVDPDRLRTVDARTHEELTLDTRTNASRGTSIRTFGIDLRRDLVRAVAGEPDDPTFAVRLAGADPLWIDARVTFNGLSDLCAATLAAYQDDRYRERFGWIDQLRPVTDPAETAVLDGRLDAQLATVITRTSS